MRIYFALAFLGLTLLAPSPAFAQRGPELEVSLLASSSPPLGVNVRAARMLGDARMRELLLSGFPAAMRFRLELWRVGGLFNDLEGAADWDMIVQYDPYSRHYRVARRRGPREVEDFGPLATLGDVESVVERPYPVALRPARRGGRYYYSVTLEVETLSLSDLDELQRWLRGELEPAVRGRRDPFSAFRRGFGTLLSRVLGGERRQFEARTATFRVD